ncbi:ArsR/SmtB family transcription factor [Amycolatopsis nigrescens]|uniref:ArsR/SmtB family transcription factor n=1 Tax=Amycolatopsis nigrescens TaxID=381445 RepID=UPI00036EA175|nr:ArsR family transcriptional regulator [Amycolatopsis nigrescens]
MLRILFTADDLLLTRFLPEPAPLMETKFALIALDRGNDAPWGDRWRRHARAGFPASARPARELVSTHAGAFSPTALNADLDEALETALRLGTDRGRAELTLWYGNGNIEAPSWLLHAVEGHLEARRLLVRGFASAFAAVLQPYWEQIRAHYHRELVRHSRVLARRGVGAALVSAIQGARWRGDCLEIDSAQQRTVCLRGRGLVLVPTAFWTGPPLVADAPDQPVHLACPARAMTGLRIGDEPDALEGILGCTRAAVLRLLTGENTTSGIARQLGISQASASEHAAALRAAGLVISRREGKAVVHHAGALGLDLISTNTP